MSAILLVVDYLGLNEKKFYARLNGALTAVMAPDVPLHVSAFVDDPEGKVASYVQKKWPGKVHFIDTALIMQEQGISVRAEIVEFFEQIRNGLRKLAESRYGEKWAERFGNLWWYTELSEKNSPGNPIWWHIVRGKLVARFMDDGQKYQACALVGSTELGGIVRQACIAAKVTYYGTHLNPLPCALLRALLERVWGACCHIFAVTIAYVCFRGLYDRTCDITTKKPRIFLYTWFPRVWTMRDGKWQDMYYGKTLDRLIESAAVEPFFVARMYDRPDFVSPITYWKRLRMFQSSKLQPYHGLVLEAFTTPWNVFKSYFRMADFIRYARFIKEKECKKEFVHHGISFYKICVPRLTRSALVHWPHGEVLEGCAENLTRVYAPRTVALYCFEYIYGRALISGTRQARTGTQVVGVQHGPITWMKWLYAGLGNVGKRYCPDVYAIDGQISAEILREGGIQDTEICITGPARFDSIWPRARVSKNSTLTDEGAPGEGTKRISVLVAPGLHDTQFMLMFVFKALLQDQRLHLIVKKHPKVPLPLVEALVQSFRSGVEGGATVEIVRTGDMYDWMGKTDIFLSTYSSTGVEAIAFNLPVILLVSRKTPDMSLFYGVESGILTASTPEELRERIGRLVRDDSFRNAYMAQLRRVLKESFGEIDSGASNRLAMRL
ncbi:MAG: hypothetical protein Q7S48_03185 [bacterium]|nr:hypothetical protein [bacterium]